MLCLGTLRKSWERSLNRLATCRMQCEANLGPTCPTCFLSIKNLMLFLDSKLNKSDKSAHVEIVFSFGKFIFVYSMASCFLAGSNAVLAKSGSSCQRLTGGPKTTSSAFETPSSRSCTGCGRAQRSYLSPTTYVHSTNCEHPLT